MDEIQEEIRAFLEAVAEASLVEGYTRAVVGAFYVMKVGYFILVVVTQEDGLKFFHFHDYIQPEVALELIEAVFDNGPLRIVDDPNPPLCVEQVEALTDRVLGGLFDHLCWVGGFNNVPSSFFGPFQQLLLRSEREDLFLQSKLEMAGEAIWNKPAHDYN